MVLSELSEVVMAIIALCALGVATLNFTVLRKISDLIREHQRLRQAQIALRKRVGALPCILKGK